MTALSPAPAARILVVEDEALVASWLGSLLEDLGHVVVGTCSTAEDALRAAAAAPPDLVLMDILLKGPMTGIDAAARLRSEHDVPVVFVTAYADTETIARVSQTAPYGYLVKPFDDRTLSGALETALARSALERRLREQERFLRATLMAVGDGVVAADADGALLLMNPVAEELTLWSEEEARGRPLDAVVRLEGLDASGSDVLAEALRRSHRDEAGILVRRDGRRLPVSVQTRAYGGAASRPAGRVVVLRDLTSRLATEESLRRSERLSAAGHLLWEFAHEARNPLFGLSATLDLIRDGFEPPSALGGPIAGLRQEIERLDTLTRRILDRPHAPPALPATLPPATLVEAAKRSCAELAAQRGVAISCDVPADLPSVRGHEGPLVQMLAQIFLNAVQHSPRGSTVRIDGRVPPGRDGFLLLEVRDSGPGIPEQDQDRVFEPFFSRQRGGSGLGLTEVRRIAEEHGGHARISNGSNGGAIVTITVPALPGVPSAEP